MKNYLIILGLLFTLVGCGQTQKETKKTNKKDFTMNEDVLEDDIYLMKLKKFKYEPQYQIEVETYYPYDIRVNDMPITSQIPPTTRSMLFPANTCILESGLQSISFNIYPRFYENDETKQRDNLENPNLINFKIRVLQTAWVKGSLEEPKEVFKYDLSADAEEISDITQKSKLYKMFTFKAEVPYKLLGWKDSKVFNPKDSVKLEKQVFNFYSKYRRMMVKNELYDLIKISQNQAYETSQYYYLDRDKVISDRKEYLRNDKKEKFMMADIVNYKLMFYGDNRVLGLVFQHDGEMGKPCINKLTLDKEGSIEAEYTQLLLHQPKGSDQLEIIR